MKAYYWLLSLGCLTLALPSGTVQAQNQVPSITNLSVTNDHTNRRLEITYDLADAEETDLEVALKISGDGGVTYLAGAGKVQGAVGFPVKTGPAKKIFWEYGAAAPSSSCRVKLIACDRVAVDIRDIVGQVDSTNLKNNLAYLYGMRDHTRKGLAHLAEVRDTIERCFTNAGLRAYRQDTSVTKGDLKKSILAALEAKGGRPPKPNPLYHLQNIIGELPGQADSSLYLLTAHYDSAPGSPGADDNASGVAGIMEAARILGKYNFRHSIKFIGFDLEEAGFYGSFLYLLSGVKKHEKIKGCINFDMISYYSETPGTQVIPPGFEVLFPEVSSTIIKDGNRANFVVNTSNNNSRALGEKFSAGAAQYVPGLKVASLVAHGNGEFTRNLAYSDHGPFWMLGYQALHIGDGGETRNVNLNTSKDQITGNINYTFMSNVVKATIATLASLAEVQHSTEVISSLQ